MKSNSTTKRWKASHWLRVVGERAIFPDLNFLVTFCFKTKSDSPKAILYFQQKKHPNTDSLAFSKPLSIELVSKAEKKSDFFILFIKQHNES